jgi:uncharacterized HAD superfamily protein
MRIGFELDGVICDILGAAIKSFGDPQQSGAYTFDELYPLIPIEDLEMWLESPSVYAEIGEVPHARQGLLSLARCHELFAVTNREQYLSKVTVPWMRDRGLGFVSIQYGGSKDIEVQRLMLDVYVEASAQDARDISDFCDVYVLDNIYNRFGCGPATRVKDWNHLLGEIGRG